MPCTRYALHSPTTDRPGPLAEAVEELRRSETDRKAFPTYLTWLLRSLGEPGDGALLRWLATPGLAANDHQDLLRTAVARGLRLPAELLRTCIQWGQCRHRRLARPPPARPSRRSSAPARGRRRSPGGCPR
ncbi:hypothetical protein [Streptomyces amritsarensis]|uniref:hypothetical protein n=1 Tax=Streptomyces amritsarensis TaxID=681158 RepID=UPI00117EA279|nr:hypothetical protein [Streptomyces amritsarensis]